GTFGSRTPSAFRRQRCAASNEEQWLGPKAGSLTVLRSTGRLRIKVDAQFVQLILSVAPRRRRSPVRNPVFRSKLPGFRWVKTGLGFFMSVVEAMPSVHNCSNAAVRSQSFRGLGNATIVARTIPRALWNTSGTSATPTCRSSAELRKALPSNFARPQDNSGNARILAGRARILAIVLTILHAVGRARTQRLPRGDG